MSDAGDNHGWRARAGGSAGAPLAVLHVFPSFAVGGAQARFITLANAIPGMVHHVVALDDDFAAAERVSGAVELHLHHIETQKTGFVSLRNLRAARGMLRDAAPDVLCTYNWGAIEWAAANRLMRRAPHLHFEDGFGAQEDETHQIGRRVLARRVILGSGTRVVVPSKTLQRLATGRWGLPAGRVMQIDNGVDLDRFASVSDPLALRKDAGEIVIGSVGALRAEKNFARLIRAFDAAGLAGRARLVIAGDGPERPLLQREIATRNLGEAVSLIGRVDAPERIYAALDIFALSSDTEQMPISLIEAMAAGLPTAATDVGDVGDMLAPENRGFLATRDAEADLALALRRLADDADLRRRLGAANAGVARARFDAARMVARYEALFHEMAAGRGT